MSLEYLGSHLKNDPILNLKKKYLWCDTLKQQHHYLMHDIGIPFVIAFDYGKNPMLIFVLYFEILV